jgi:hypothetical protein
VPDAQALLQRLQQGQAVVALSREQSDAMDPALQSRLRLVARAGLYRLYLPAAPG